MTVLLENDCVYRGGSVGRPFKGTARLYDDRIEVTGADGVVLGAFPLAGISKSKASGATVFIKGTPFKSASIEFMALRTKLLLAVLGVIPLLIAMYAGKGRKAAVAWNAKLEELRALPSAPPAGQAGPAAPDGA